MKSNILNPNTWSKPAENLQVSAATAGLPAPENTPAEAPGVAGIGVRRALYVDNPIYAEAAYGPNHPLAIARTQSVRELCRINGWLPAHASCVSEPADPRDLSRFHSRDYIRALRAADEAGRASRAVRERYAVGTMENPVFRGVFRRAASTVGGSITAARLALDGRVVYHPAGGTHHGRPDRASGFCYFNDPVFAIATLLDAGIGHVLYADLDAHHGDGVEDAWRDDPRVALFSIHEAARWPHTGPIESAERERICNVPVPRGCNDTEYAYVLDELLEPLVERTKPEAVVITCGADALHGDPLSTMALSNVALWQAVERIAAYADSVVVLGGGGYNPWTVARCWSGLWARLSGQPIADTLPAAAVHVLGELESDLVDEDERDPAWLDTITDEPRTGAIRPEIETLVQQCRGQQPGQGARIVQPAINGDRTHP